LSDSERKLFESHFYTGTATLEAYLCRILELGRCIHARDADFGNEFWRGSLDFIASELPSILAQPRVLYHQDVSNLHVNDGRFMGFFDLEMCRVGCAAMQLGSALGMLGEDGAGWEPFAAGWNEAAAAPLTLADRRAAAAVWHLLQWRVISRYLSYDGTPGSGHAWAGPADPAFHRSSIQFVRDLLGV
jgi:Ser/Thr protein kinase RdoA (MazF antagonist)